MRVDHVIFGVADLDVARRRLADDHGLQAQEGGEHPGLGTRNCLVPVGAGQYLELMAVADPDAAHPLPLFLTARISARDRPIAWCLAPGDLDAVAARLSLDIDHGERHTPAGDVVRWRMAGLEAAMGPERLPFFIDWMGAGPGLDGSLNPVCNGIAWVEVGGDPARLHQWVVEGSEIPIRFVDAEPGPVAVGVRRGDEVIAVR